MDLRCTLEPTLLSLCLISHAFFSGVVVFSSSDGLKHLEEIKLNKCIYIEDTCLERLSSIENLQDSLYMMEVVSCGNVTDKGIIALHRLRWRCRLLKLWPTQWPKGEKKGKYLPVSWLNMLLGHRNLEYLFLSDLPGITDKQKTIERLQTALPRLDIALDLDWRTPDSGSPSEQEGILDPGSCDMMLIPLSCLSFVKCVEDNSEVWLWKSTWCNRAWKRNDDAL